MNDGKERIVPRRDVVESHGHDGGSRYLGGSGSESNRPSRLNFGCGGVARGVLNFDKLALGYGDCNLEGPSVGEERNFGNVDSK